MLPTPSKRLHNSNEHAQQLHNLYNPISLIHEVIMAAPFYQIVLRVRLLVVYLYKLYKALLARPHNSLVVRYHFKVEEKTIPKYL